MEFNAGASVKAGWETFKKRPWFFIGMAIAVMAIGWLIGFVSGGVQGAVRASGSGVGAGLLGFIVSFCLQTLLAMGTTAFYLKAHDAPESATFEDLWHPQPYIVYLVMSALMGLFIFIGAIFLIIPGIIVWLMILFAPYLVISRSLGVFESFKESARITKGHRWELFIMMILLLLINILGFICLFVGLLVTIPVTYLAVVHAYRTLEQAASEPVAAA